MLKSNSKAVMLKSTETYIPSQLVSLSRVVPQTKWPLQEHGGPRLYFYKGCCLYDKRKKILIKNSKVSARKLINLKIQVTAVWTIG